MEHQHCRALLGIRDEYSTAPTLDTKGKKGQMCSECIIPAFCVASEITDFMVCVLRADISKPYGGSLKYPDSTFDHP